MLILYKIHIKEGSKKASAHSKPEKGEKMRIINLQAENIKRLVAVEITPKDNLVQITGKNGQGKTSVLDCIWWALEGAKNIQSEPIRKGADSAFIKLSLGEGQQVELIVSRTFIKKESGEVTTKLRILNEDGKTIPGGGQAMLDKFLDALSLDPLEFKRMKPKEQFDMLKTFIPEVNFAEIEQKNQSDYDERRHINRSIKEKIAVLERQKKLLKSKDPVKSIDKTTILEQLKEAEAHNNDVTERKNNRKMMAQRIEENKKAIQQLTEENNKIQSKLVSAGELPQLKDINSFVTELNKADEINEQARLYDEVEKSSKEIDDLIKKVNQLTDEMKKREEFKNEKIAQANLPVEGIGFGDGIILLNGVPFNQASDAEQLKACIAISMAKDPELKVIRVRDGSLLDEDSEKIIREEAAKRGFDVWQEKVDSSGKIGFVIEDGKLKNSQNEESENLDGWD